MLDKTKLLIVIFAIIAVMLFGNKKVRVFPLVKKQLQVFKNAKTNKISIWDIACFVIEYSCAMKSHFRKFGNQMSGSGNHLCKYMSLLA